jgi:hypothetical protein
MAKTLTIGDINSNSEEESSGDSNRSGESSSDDDDSDEQRQCQYKSTSIQGPFYCTELRNTDSDMSSKSNDNTESKSANVDIDNESYISVDGTQYSQKDFNRCISILSTNGWLDDTIIQIQMRHLKTKHQDDSLEKIFVNP